MYEIRARPKQLISPTGSKDLQMVNIGLRVLFRPQVNQLPEMYRQLGTDYDERVLPSICNEVHNYYYRVTRSSYYMLITELQAHRMSQEQIKGKDV